MTTAQPTILTSKRKGTPLGYFLMFVFALFIGILVVVYIITKRSNPIMLDEHGKPVPTSSIDCPGRERGAIRT